MGAASHVGKVRAVNEDSYLAVGRVGVVADGMGGHAAGDVASAVTIDVFRRLAEADEITAESVRVAVTAANDAVLAQAAQAPELSGMGTTLTGIALVDYAGSPHWMVFNVGDSRVYRIDATGAAQLTVDHSEVAELVSLGRITAEEAVTHPLRSIVTRALGSDPGPDADVWIFPTDPAGETFVLCSDGVTNELADDVIARLVTSSPSAEVAAERVVTAAVDHGGRDNATAVVVASVGAVVHDDLADTAPRPRQGLA